MLHVLHFMMDRARLADGPNISPVNNSVGETSWEFSLFRNSDELSLFYMKANDKDYGTVSIKHNRVAYLLNHYKGE